MAAKGWSTPFDDPIPLPRGRQLVTLKDAGTYIIKLPKAEHEAAEWHHARDLCRADTMVPRIGMMRALYPNGPAPTRRKKPARKYGIVR